MPQANFSFIYMGFVFLAGVYRIWRLIKSYQRPVGCRGKVYTPMTYTILLLIYFTIALLAIMEYFIVRSSGRINLWVSLGGVILYAGVIPVRERAIDVLGKNMSPEVEIKPDHQLIREGVYSYLRHPLALCVILELAGFTLASNSYYAFLGVVLVFFPFILLRIYLEDQALTEKFGDEHLAYKKEVYALLPLKRRSF